MESSKQFRTINIITLIGLTALAGVIYSFSETSEVKANNISSYSTVDVSFRNNESYISYKSSSRIKNSQFNYIVDNCSYDYNELQIGSVGYSWDWLNWPWSWNWHSFTIGGSFTITLKNFKYRSVRIYSNSVPGISFNVNGISTVTNSNAHSQYDYYYCLDAQSTLTISVPDNMEVNKMLSVQKIELNIKKEAV